MCMSQIRRGYVRSLHFYVNAMMMLNTEAAIVSIVYNQAIIQAVKRAESYTTIYILICINSRVITVYVENNDTIAE